MSDFFKIFHKSKKSKARLGEIKTDHGVIKTPAFMVAGTKGTIKALPPQFIKDIGIQACFVNSYHLVAHPGVEIIQKAGGIHKFANLNIPLMSDSGGFQVFSLAGDKTRQCNFYHTRISPLRGPLESEKITPASSSKNPTRKTDIRGEEQPLVVKISEDGVKFRSTFDGKLIEFTPEKSMEYQRKIGADINMAFDECTYYPASHEYAEKAMKRTHEWLKQCIDYLKTRQRNFYHTRTSPSPKGGVPLESEKIAFASSFKNKQYLYGIIQGATFEDLRKKSAEFVVSQNTPGVAIGGVSVGETKREMREQVRWVNDYLPKDRPVHLLGVGQIDDIIDLVKYGVDTFDCVEPTRLARMGSIYQISKNEEIDITKIIYKNNLESVDEDCNCYVCKNFTKSYLHHLFKQREILGYTLATYHNLWVMERLFDRIRELITEDKI
ncbi:MAG: tRNA guanosine(34) transglycosylase Tgt [Candidatus Roizmanbacteria bacterium]